MFVIEKLTRKLADEGCVDQSRDRVRQRGQNDLRAQDAWVSTPIVRIANHTMPDTA